MNKHQAKKKPYTFFGHTLERVSDAYRAKGKGWSVDVSPDRVIEGDWRASAGVGDYVCVEKSHPKIPVALRQIERELKKLHKQVRSLVAPRVRGR